MVVILHRLYVIEITITRFFVKFGDIGPLIMPLGLVRQDALNEPVNFMFYDTFARDEKNLSQFGQLRNVIPTITHFSANIEDTELITIPLSSS